MKKKIECVQKLHLDGKTFTTPLSFKEMISSHGIFDGGVQIGFPNPDPISEQKRLFSDTLFQTWPSDLEWI